MSPPFADIQDAAQSAASWTSGAVQALSPLDWVLFGIAFVIGYFLKRRLNLIGAEISVEVELLDTDANPDAPVHALTSTLRERLATNGVVAPIVPAGTPRVGLIDAVAASPVPQGAWIAKVMEALPIPEPLQYKLSGTLFKQELNEYVSVWLRPNSRGRPLIRTFPETPGEAPVEYAEAISSAAFEVYSFISTQALHAFPVWTRWHSAGAVDDYARGSRQARRDEFESARNWLTEAARREPDNALVWLQLANIHERLAYQGEAGAEVEARREADARRQAKTLRRYLWIAHEWPWLVQARYRASVLAGALGGACRRVGEERRDSAADASRRGARAGLGLSPEADVVAVLDTIAKSESDFTLQLLKPWYMLLRWRRVRSPFEPSAEERRQLKRAVGISRHCRGVRVMRFNDPWPMLAWNWLKTRYSEVAVRCWHLSLGLVELDWQTHYVSACFESLLLEHARRRSLSRQLSEPLMRRVVRYRQDRSNQKRGLIARLGGLRRGWWQKHLRCNAFRSLDQAIAGAGAQLPVPWVLTGDPDLEALREPAALWQEQVRALHAAGPTAIHGEGPPNNEPPPVARPKPPRLRSPRRPWPKPILRVVVWTVLAVAGATVVLAVADWAWPWLVAGGIFVAFCLWRAVLALRERRRERAILGALNRPPDDSRSSRSP